MKNHLLFIAIFAISFGAYAQGSTGLIAHWDMNGNGNDVTGNGHNGHLSNVTLTTGRSGLPNTAYSFNGTTSVITVPASAALNLTQFSICAIVNPSAFYSGLCQVNSILCKGRVNGPGTYGLMFFDNPYDGGDCNAQDNTKDVFAATAGGCVPTSIPCWQYSPQISLSTWYTVVATWDGSKFQIFVNGVLKTSTVYTGSAVFGSGTDSLSIGLDIFDAPGYPYAFTGKIDDIRIYNRILSDVEVVHYNSLGVDNIVSDDDIVMMPNPACNQLTISLPSNITTGSIEIINQLGQSMMASNISKNEITMDITNLPSGIYYTRVSANGQVINKKLIKQ